MKSFESYIYKFIVNNLVKGFDANFYLSNYDDLGALKTKWEALKHYVMSGRSAGKFPNEKVCFDDAKRSNWNLGDGFDIVAYKFFNKDLMSVFSDDGDFFRHYLRHGRKEGRVCRFPATHDTVRTIPPEEKWKSIFSMPDFIAYCDENSGDIPRTRESAIALFWERGVGKLWPVNFEYTFDGDFLRKSGAMQSHQSKSDIDLYRAWLTEGFPSGVAPNERIYLASYLGGLPFPSGFDWRAFLQRAKMKADTTRSEALIALFSAPGKEVVRNSDLLGNDAAWVLYYVGRRALAHGDYQKAAHVLEHSVVLARKAEVLTLLGDAYLKSGSLNEALERYVAALTSADRAPISAFVQASTILASRRQFPEAFDVLRRAHPAWRHRPEFAQKLQEIVQLYFAHQSARAHEYLRGISEPEFDQRSRAASDELLVETLNDIRALYLELDDMPVLTGGNPDGYVIVLANDDLRQCTHYRIEQKIFQFHEVGIPVKVFSHSEPQEFLENLVGARAAIFYRVAAVPSVLRVILHAVNMGLKTYYEIDDLIFDLRYYPDSFSSFEGQISAAEYAGLNFGVPLFRYAMSMCDASIASTPALAERMGEVTSTHSSIVIRNGLDERNETAIMMARNPVRRKNGRVRIFYGSGTKAHNADFNKLVAPAISDLMNRNAHVDLVIVGHLRLGSELEALSARIMSFPFISDITAYWSILATCDINLAVLEIGTVADCKSEIKWLEAAVLQIPSIVSATRTYREIIEHRVNGFLAGSEGDWHSMLSELISDQGLREKVGAKAREKALLEYNLGVTARTLNTAFGKSERDVPSAPARRIRVLVCNVFYAPQSHGGATRVVEDNVRTFVEKYPDLEIGVFCSDDGAPSPGSLRMGAENGVPVYRLSVKQEANMDWRPFNDGHAEPFARVLDHYRPDIIHFHCIQRLTATLVEVALARGIPYVVTLHDAWWISDNQFLMDEDGILRLPGLDILADSNRSHDSLASLARRTRLMSLLQNSRANLSVSAPFARIYENAGITNVRVVENGVPQIEKVPRSARKDGRVALGHIGGRAAHKGASLIEASLREGTYQNLHLTMVDGTLSDGQSFDAIWGTTPVTLVAPYRQAQVAELYGQLDVLLAPSTWPESYGLVTREALKSGLWVVASNLGAIGQEVEHDRNGFVIDVSASKDLKCVLAKIDADAQRFRMRPPIDDRHMRTMDDQADELHELYHELVNSRMIGTDKNQGRASLAY